MLKTNATSLDRLKEWELAADKLMRFRQQLLDTTNINYTGYKRLGVTNIWADMDRMCQIVVKGRLGAFAQGYLFDQNPETTAQDVMSDLTDARKSPDDPIANSLEDVLRHENIIRLQQMVSSHEIAQGHGDAPSLTIPQIKGKVQDRLARCRIDPARLEGTIVFKPKWNEKLPEVREIKLVRLRFAVADNSNPGRP
jgi:hypothetical protein